MFCFKTGALSQFAVDVVSNSIADAPSLAAGAAHFIIFASFAVKFFYRFLKPSLVPNVFKALVAFPVLNFLFFSCPFYYVMAAFPELHFPSLFPLACPLNWQFELPKVMPNIIAAVLTNFYPHALSANKALSSNNHG